MVCSFLMMYLSRFGVKDLGNVLSSVFWKSLWRMGIKSFEWTHQCSHLDLHFSLWVVLITNSIFYLLQVYLDCLLFGSLCLSGNLFHLPRPGYIIVIILLICLVISWIILVQTIPLTLTPQCLASGIVSQGGTLLGICTVTLGWK